ncbi:MAG: type II toxin-antitoxin system Phd/YefM family antitoxin [Candidatus Eremiobacteraeota bacterium]|nr:type II toxin-antitoxin system Phd/YefM family antitoxin [Candidatus Eremiobacteraeota bacterium]
MLRKINAMEARQTLGQIMNAVNLRNDEYIIERKGRPIAALVPVWMVLNKRKRSIEFLKLLQKGRENIGDRSREEIQAVINEAIEETRKQSGQTE